MKKVICLILSVITLVGVLPMGVYAEERPFPDVPADAWYAETIVKAHELGIIQGDEKGNMMPTKPITRAEAVTIIRNLCVILTDYDEISDIPFTDVKKDDWFYEDVKWAYCSNITIGVGNNKFQPNDYITREDFMVMLYKFYNFCFLPNAYETELYQKSFKDIDKVSTYAKEIIKVFTCNFMKYSQNGMMWTPSFISGNNGYIMPQKTCSRSEAIKIILNIKNSDVMTWFYFDTEIEPSPSIPLFGGKYIDYCSTIK